MLLLAQVGKQPRVLSVQRNPKTLQEHTFRERSLMNTGAAGVPAATYPTPYTPWGGISAHEANEQPHMLGLRQPSQPHLDLRELAQSA